MKYFNSLKNYIFKEKSETDIFKNMSILAIGVGGAQIISFAATPILTRMYLPEHFGILAIFVAVVGLIGPFNTLRYSVAIPLLKRDGIAINLLAATAFILFFVICIVTIVLMVYAREIFGFFSIASLFPYWWLLPIAVFGSGLYEILNSWSIRQKMFKAIAKTKITQTLSSSIIKIIIGFFEAKSIGLLIGNVIATFLSALLLIGSNYTSMRLAFKHMRLQRILFLLKRYVEYPKYRVLSQFILVLALQAPLLFLAAFFGADTAGYFGLTMMVLSIPLALFGNTTGQAYYAEIAKIGRKKPHKIYAVTKDVVKRLFLFSLIPFLALLIYSPWLFYIVFGENWQESGVYASIMSFYMFTAFISAPLMNALSVFENQLVFLKLNLIRLSILIVLFFVSWLMNFDAIETIFCYSIVMSLYFIYLSYYIFKVIRSKITVGEDVVSKTL